LATDALKLILTFVSDRRLAVDSLVETAQTLANAAFTNQRELLMRLRLALLCLIAFNNSALAQYGVSNQRNAQGNLVRKSGVYSPTGINQGPVNNGPIKNAPAQPPTANAGTNKGANR
jgi:hypothetical protein